jgi:hypothetical protein
VSFLVFDDVFAFAEASVTQSAYVYVVRLQVRAVIISIQEHFLQLIVGKSYFRSQWRRNFRSHLGHLNSSSGRSSA